MSANPPEPTHDETPSDFLRSLVDAMRRVVEATSDRTLAEMREAVESEAGQLDMSRAAREAGLRAHAEAETTGVGSWERAEIERIRADALRKVQARGSQLDQELAELTAANTADHAALAARADAYEREVADFIEGLEGIKDPAAFAAAARRMPSPWVARTSQPASASPVAPAAPPVEVKVAEAAAEPSASTSTAAAPSEAAPTEAASPDAPAVEAAPVAQPAPAPAPATAPEPMAVEPVASADAPAAERNGTAVAIDAAAADVVPAEPVAPEPVAPEPVAPEPVAPEPVADQATSIQVHGLGSFGAITSFKQSLEKVDGIRSVTLGLGPSGEFIYTATHAPSFDLGSAIRAIEGEGVEIERDNGTLRVKVGKAARAG